MSSSGALKIVSSLLLCATFLHGTASAETGRERLESFLRNLSSLQATFVQTIYGENGRRLEKSSGQVALLRPGQFRWDYQTPFPQTIVADGEKVWFYDPELAQVTVKPMGTAIGETPALLLLGSDRPLEDDFSFVEMKPDGERLWVELRPRQEDASFTAVRMGFHGEQLAAMELLDNFGQRTRLELSEYQHNPTLAPELFRFVVPTGVDVLEDGTLR